MPAKDIGLYAKWTPVNHTIRFFRTYDDMIAFETTGNANGMIETREITHGSVLGSVDNPSLSIGGLAYTFGGWFYMRAGNKNSVYAAGYARYNRYECLCRLGYTLGTTLPNPLML